MSSIYNAWLQFTAVVLGTFASEDLTCIATGQLIREGRLPAFTGVAACFVGIFVGDLSLWALGWLSGRFLLPLKWVAKRAPADRFDVAGRWFQQNGWAAVFAARFLPGTRLPVYVAAGAMRGSFRRFFWWSLLAALVWTPLVVFGAVGLGAAIDAPLRESNISGRLILPLSLLCAFVVLWLGRKIVHRRDRIKLAVCIARIWRWEFWPSWLFYIPVLFWIGLLALRYRSLTAWTSANPGIPQGGVIGESKYAILSLLVGEGVLPTVLLPSGDLPARVQTFLDQVKRRGWNFPLILKPDASQRGAGLKLAYCQSDVTRYLESNAAAVIVQPYHPGPYEAGIFYYRLLGATTGKIFSITDKHFPAITGDGKSTLEELIWNHPRYRMQASTFLKRHAAETNRVLACGESLRLAIAGNHCQGTMSCDGAHLCTPELERAIDAVAQRFPGFYIGRFDVRYSDAAAFKAGRELAIVELNGVTSESTNVYDPAGSLWSAYRILFRQWSLIYKIGNANRSCGIQQAGVAELVRCIREFYSRPQVNPLAD